MPIYEASDFWDEHDFDEFGDFEQVEDMKFGSMLFCMGNF